MPDSIDIRWLIHADLPQVLAIEQASFASPWCEEAFLATLRQPCVIGQVAESKTWIASNVIGFMVYELGEKTIELLNIAVHPAHRLNRVGMRMIGKLYAKLPTSRRKTITLDVRETNLTAQMFFRSVGFKATRVIRGMYEDTGEDGYRMRFKLPREVQEVKRSCP